MDPLRNPYAPGAGAQPPELTGRSRILGEADITLQRRLRGKPSKSSILVGLRGVGKTVLLNRIDELAQTVGYRTAFVEFVEGRPLAQALVLALRSVLLGLDRGEAIAEQVKRGLRVLKSFASKVSLKFGEVDIGLAIDPERGVADSGDLETDLSELLVAVGEAARERETGVALILDEIQYLAEPDFAALITALHRASQLESPIVMYAAGLPTARGLAGRAKSYAERLFDFPPVGALGIEDARAALQVPAAHEGASFTAPAIDEIIRITEGYPYFLQEWAYQAWNAATASTITEDDVRRANTAALERLDEGFFGVRFDRLTQSEKKYLRAMAGLGPGPHRTGDVALAYGAKPTSLGPVRSTLLAKGMIYAPSHGETQFTVPLFDRFMLRKIP